MSKEIEIEFKILLNKKTYSKIYKDLIKKPHKLYIQTNYYLTHPNLEKNKMMLRIRQIDDTFELTLKEPYIDSSLETNLPLTLEQKNKIINHQPYPNTIFTYLQKYNINALDLQQPYSLTTTRLDYKYNDGMISLDYNEYLNTKDYELEYEVPNKEIGLEHFYNFIKPYKIQYTTNCFGKSKRLRKKLKKNSAA